MTICTGVIHQNECDMQYLSESESTNLTYFEALKEAKESIIDDIKCASNFDEIKEILQFRLDDIMDDSYEFYESTYLIGDWKKDGEEWIPDKEGREGFAAIWYSDGHIQVIWSNTVKECSLCSPCFPFQGDLSAKENGIFAYSLPLDFYIEKE